MYTLCQAISSAQGGIYNVVTDYFLRTPPPAFRRFHVGAVFFLVGVISAAQLFFLCPQVIIVMKTGISICAGILISGFFLGEIVYSDSVTLINP
jgi:hypothetical protein